MPYILRLSIILSLLLPVMLVGCYNKPVRHLASDASLIKVGSSTRNDVLTYLGEPDGQRMLEDGREEWVYVEERPTELQRIPVVGRYFDSSGQEKVFIMLNNDIVQSCEFREFGEGEFDWADQYSWQEKEE